MKSEFYVSKIFVIESLTEDDRHTGTSLYEDIIERSLMRRPKLGCKLMRPGGYTEFVNCLDEVLQEAKLSDGFPYIHFEIHGSRDYVYLTNGHKMPWELLYGHLQLINLMSRNNLFVSFATCHSTSILSYINPNKTAPFYGFVGPRHEILEGDAEAYFVDFFKTLIDTESMSETIKRVSSGEDITDSKCDFFHAESLFDTFYNKMFVEPTMNNDNFEKLTNQLFRNICNSWPDVFQKKSIPEIRAMVRQLIVKDNNWLRSLSRRIFLIQNFTDEEIMKSYNEVQNDLKLIQSSLLTSSPPQTKHPQLTRSDYL